MKKRKETSCGTSWGELETKNRRTNLIQKKEGRQGRRRGRTRECNKPPNWNVDNLTSTPQKRGEQKHNGVKKVSGGNKKKNVQNAKFAWEGQEV